MIERIFGFWTGDNPMTANRQRGWDSFTATGLDPILVTPDTLGDWVVTGHPLHDAYECLSSVHRSDYLRAYFMHHHGGGYADIKNQSGSWLATVAAVNASPRLLGAGYQEVYGGTVTLHHSPVAGRYHMLSIPLPREAARAATYAIRVCRPWLIGKGAFYFKPRTAFTGKWLAEVERRLDLLLPHLALSPATSPRARLGDGSGYPVPWYALLGDIIHPLSAIYTRRLRRNLPPPDFTHYQ